VLAHVAAHETPAYWNVWAGPEPTTIPRPQQISPGQPSGPLQVSSTKPWPHWPDFPQWSGGLPEVGLKQQMSPAGHVLSAQLTGGSGLPLLLAAVVLELLAVLLLLAAVVLELLLELLAAVVLELLDCAVVCPELVVPLLALVAAAPPLPPAPDPPKSESPATPPQALEAAASAPITTKLKRFITAISLRKARPEPPRRPRKCAPRVRSEAPSEGDHQARQRVHVEGQDPGGRGAVVVDLAVDLGGEPLVDVHHEGGVVEEPEVGESVDPGL